MPANTTFEDFFEVRYLDKLVDELAKGKSMDKVLRRGVLQAQGDQSFSTGA